MHTKFYKKKYICRSYGPLKYWHLGKKILFTRTFPETTNKYFPKNKTCLLHFFTSVYQILKIPESILRLILVVFVNILGYGYSGSKLVFFRITLKPYRNQEQKKKDKIHAYRSGA